MRLWTLALLATLPALNGCTGIDPIDNLLNPPKSQTRNVAFHNAGNAPAQVELYWGDVVSDNRCEPYAGRRSLTVAAGGSVNLSMTKKCRYGGHFNMSINLLPNVTFAALDFIDEAAARALKPGQQVLLATDNFTVQTTLTILDGNTAGQRGGAWLHAHPSPGGIDEWELVAEVPASMMGRSLMFGIPATLAITSLNSVPLKLVNGMYTGAAISQTGVWISPDVGADANITCAEASCHVE